MKPGNMGTLRSLMIPAPGVTGRVNNVKDPKMYMEVGDPEIMFDILLRKNFDHLLLSQSSMFSKGPILDKCGWYREEQGIEDLVLNGMLDCEEIGNHIQNLEIREWNFCMPQELIWIKTGKNQNHSGGNLGSSSIKRYLITQRKSQPVGPQDYT